MSNLQLELNNALNNRKRVLGAFALLVEMVDQAAENYAGVGLNSPDGAELLAMFHREFSRADERIENAVTALGLGA